MKRTHPPDPETAVLQLVNGIPIHGGFPSGGGQRNWKANETILDGTLSELDGTLGESGLDRIVLAEDVNKATILDGFTIKNSGQYGIYCFDDGESNIVNCRIEHNNEAGIYCLRSDPNITNCVIFNNGNTSAAGGGIYYSYSSPRITNCTCKSNQAEYGGGIYNRSYSLPTVTNCILWDNSPDEIYGSGVTVIFSDVNGTTVYPGEGNIKADPCFYNPGDPNSYHLTADSPCIDAGSNSAVPTFILTDIDGEDRIMDGDSNATVIVDMGADEYYWSPADFDRDEVVNFVDYAIFANAWLSEPGEPVWNPKCDISNPVDSYIDYNDLALLCKDWLWLAAWNQTLGSMMMGQGMGGGMDQGLGIGETYLSASAEQQQQAEISQSCSELAEPIDIKEFLKQLEEIWLDPDVQEAIDEDTWLKFIESVKSELE